MTVTQAARPLRRTLAERLDLYRLRHPLLALILAGLPTGPRMSLVAALQADQREGYRRSRRWEVKL